MPLARYLERMYPFALVVALSASVDRMHVSIPLLGVPLKEFRRSNVGLTHCRPLHVH